MLEELPFGPPDFESRAISPLKELGAYEALWVSLLITSYAAEIADA